MRITIKLVLITSLVALAGCNTAGWEYLIMYSAKSDEARRELAKKVSEESILREETYEKGQLVTGSYYRPDRLIIHCSANQREKPSFKEKRQRIEKALGPQLIKFLDVHTETYPRA